MSKKSPIKGFDFFTGCGGTCCGFRNAGMDVVFALDNDPIAANTFRYNFPGVDFLEEDIRNVNCDAILPLVNACEGYPILFSGCAPCQPFTKQKTYRPFDDIRRKLLDEFLRFIEYYRADYVFIETVPGLQKVKNSDDVFRTGTAAHVLAGTGKSYSNIEVRGDNLASEPYLQPFWYPAVIAGWSGSTYRPLQHFGQRF